MDCQLNSLRQCFKTRTLLKALDLLPKTLDSTYERILLRVPEEHRYDAHVVFCLVACARPPVPLSEADEIVAIDPAQGRSIRMTDYVIHSPY